MDGGAWWAAIHGVAKSRTQLHFHFHALEKEMAAHFPQGGGDYGVAQSRTPLAPRAPGLQSGCGQSTTPASLPPALPP